MTRLSLPLAGFVLCLAVIVVALTQIYANGGWSMVGVTLLFVAIFVAGLVWRRLGKPRP